MKIAIVSPYPPSKGTLNEYAYHLVQQLVKKPEVTEIHILSDELPAGESFPEQADKIHIHECWAFNQVNSIIRIQRKLKQIQPDSLIYNLQFLSFGSNKAVAALGLFSPLLSKLQNIATITLLHNITETVDLESAGITKNPLKKFFYNAIGTVLTKILLSSDVLAVTIPKYVEILREKYKADNVALIPHGSFETMEFPNSKIESSSRKSVMSFGKFGTYKKVEALIEACDRISKKRNEEIDIVIAGTDNPNVPGYLEGVQSQFQHVENLQFTGYVEEEDVPSLFQESTVVVFPYTSTTGSSGVLHQAGSYGKAVALPNLGDLKELIEEEGYSGAYFAPEDVESMEEAIEHLLYDEKAREDIALQNYAAASALPLEEISDWYLMHMERLQMSKAKLALAA